MRCVQNAVNNPQLPNAVAGADNWVRVRAWAFQKNTNATGPGRPIDSVWVRGADVSALAAPNGSSYLTSSQWQCVRAGTPSSFTVGQITSTEPTRPNEYTLGQVNTYVAVRVDGKGNIIGVVGVGAGGGSAIAQTCWTSFIRG
jgi:hypothetical protein